MKRPNAIHFGSMANLTWPPRLAVIEATVRTGQRQGGRSAVRRSGLALTGINEDATAT